MSAHKADVDKSYGEFNNGHNPVRVTFNVEDVALIPYAIRTVKGLLNIRITSLLAAFHNIRPYLKWQKCIWMFLRKLFQCLFGKYPHKNMSLLFGSSLFLRISTNSFTV